MWVGDDDGSDEDSEFGVWVMKVLGLEVGVGESVEAVGLSGFVVEVVVVVVGLPIWCWWAMSCGSRFWVGPWSNKFFFFFKRISTYNVHS